MLRYGRQPGNVFAVSRRGQGYPSLYRRWRGGVPLVVPGMSRGGGYPLLYQA